MATLAGQKIKDKYGNLLHVEGGVTASLKDVEDGSGNATALSVSSSAVGVDALSFTTAPSVSTTELTALLIDDSNNVVKRELDASAFSLATVTFANPMFILRPNGLYPVTTTLATPTQAGTNNNGNASSHEVNDSSNHFFPSSTTTGAINVQQEGLVKIDINFMLEISNNNTDIDVSVYEKPDGGSETLIQAIARGHVYAGNTAIGFSLVRHVAAATDLYYKISSDKAAGLLTTSTFILTKLD